MMGDDRIITNRRLIQQIVHCASEALAVVENDEDPKCAVDDLEQAAELIQKVLPSLRLEAGFGAKSPADRVKFGR